MEIIIPLGRMNGLIPDETRTELKKTGLPVEIIILNVCNYFNHIRPVYKEAFTDKLIRSYALVQGVYRKIESHVNEQTIFGDYALVSTLWMSYLTTFKTILMEFTNILHLDIIIKGYVFHDYGYSIRLDCIKMEQTC